MASVLRIKDAQGNWVEVPALKSEDKTYVHDQAASSAVWEVTHNLNKYPSVTVVDSSGDEVIGEVTYLTLNSCRITFAAAFKGKAYFN